MHISVIRTAVWKRERRYQLLTTKLIENTLSISKRISQKETEKQRLVRESDRKQPQPFTQYPPRPLYFDVFE